jgi:hypothetical protein
MREEREAGMSLRRVDSEMLIRMCEWCGAVSGAVEMG